MGKFEEIDDIFVLLLIEGEIFPTFVVDGLDVKSGFEGICLGTHPIINHQNVILCKSGQYGLDSQGLANHHLHQLMLLLKLLMPTSH